MTFIDLKKAFGSIDRDNIWNTIRALYSQIKELHSLETIKQAVDKLRLLTVTFSRDFDRVQTSAKNSEIEKELFDLLDELTGSLNELRCNHHDSHVFITLDQELSKLQLACKKIRLPNEHYEIIQQHISEIRDGPVLRFPAFGSHLESSMTDRGYETDNIRTSDQLFWDPPT